MRLLIFVLNAFKKIILFLSELLGSSDGVDLPNIDVYGHITLNTPVLVRSLKLSKVELC